MLLYVSLINKPVYNNVQTKYNTKHCATNWQRVAVGNRIKSIITKPVTKPYHCID